MSHPVLVGVSNVFVDIAAKLLGCISSRTNIELASVDEEGSRIAIPQCALSQVVGAVQMAARILGAGLVISSGSTLQSTALARRSGAHYVFDYKRDDSTVEAINAGLRSLKAGTGTLGKVAVIVDRDLVEGS
ncbi:MAG: hypothetical protein WB586_06700 [Chthoniobacterales bacterium]